ncbi:MAG: DNA-binding protein WhiA [Oscillospiraceae bacterium]|nr:DNA-binding protein WhiA [Oscillospiraceae bacterium]
MSFSGDVKRELVKIRETSKENRRLLLYGLLYGEKRSENEAVNILYKQLLKEFLYLENAQNEIEFNGNDRETGLFLRGVFLSCGSVTAPDKNYHLELNISDEKKQNKLFAMITESGIDIKKTTRKNKPLLYLKESELISDFLTFIGAGNHSMEIMNAKIFKEVRNKVNRKVNCEAANIGKTARAAGKQIADIEYIYKQKSADYLPPELRQIAELRLENFDMSLKEIGEICEPKLSRSGVFHRLEKISGIAEILRGGN